MGNCCNADTGAKHDLRGNMMRRRTMDVDIDDVYAFDRGLGHGSMGQVASIRKKDTGKIYALKTIQLNLINKMMREELRNEIDILMSLDHPNIIRPLELFERKRQMYFVMEMCSGGDLFERAPYTEKQAALYINQICSAVRYLHSKSICHRDLKFENILYESREPKAMVKLIDFGLSKRYRPGSRMNESVGTLYSMAPEVLHGNYTQACDMWSIGVIAYMLISGDMPFPGRTDNVVIRKIEAGTFHMTGRHWDVASEASKNFIRSLIRVRPKERFTAEQALKHDWLIKEWDDYRKINSQLSDRSIGQDIVHSLKEYGQFGKLRKAALMVIAHRASPEHVEKLRNAFHEIDVNREGHITLEELKQVLIEYDISPDEIESIFDSLDVDQTRKIGYTEFLAATVSAMGFVRQEQLTEAFDRLDSDDSGYITKDNLREILGSAYVAEEVDRMIEEADVKHDGRVDFEEFLELMNVQTEKEVKDVVQGSPRLGEPKEAAAQANGTQEEKC